MFETTEPPRNGQKGKAQTIVGYFFGYLCELSFNKIPRKYPDNTQIC